MVVRRSHALGALAAAALLLLLLARLPPPAAHPASHPAPAPHAASYPAPHTAPHADTSPNAPTDAASSSASPLVANSTAAARVSQPPPAAPAAPAAPADKNKKQSDKDAKVQYTKDVYVSGHTWVHAELCARLGAQLRLLVLVSSAPAHAAARRAIRLTWGHFALRHDLAIAFVLGIPPPELNASLDEENALYGDIIMGNFVDTYSNLTLKTLSMLEWASTYCPRAPRLLKTDDDMFINIPKLLDFVAAPSRVNATKTIWGKVLKKAYPMRIPKSKYYLPRAQFSGRVFPAFATGPAYVLTADCAPAILAAALTSRYVRLEDVFVTGIMADSLGIKRVHAHEFYNKKVSPHPCAIQRGVAIHMVRYHEQFDLWRKLLDGKTKCS